MYAKLISFLLFISFSDCEIIPPTINTTYDNTTDLIRTILRENPSRLVVLLKHKDTDGDLYQVTNLLVNNIWRPVYNLIDTSIQKFNGKHDNKFSYEAIVDESRLYFVFLPNVTSAENVVATLRRLYFFRPRHRIVLILNQSFQRRGELNLEELKNVFKSFWKFEILNVDFVINNQEIYTFQPFFNKFAVRIEGRNIFPDKIQNLNGFPLKMSTFIAALDAVQLNSTEVIGRDIEQWKTIADELNATYARLKPRDNITYGLKFANGKMTGVFKDVVENYTDITLNSRMVKLQFENVLEPTYPHDREDVTIILPTADSIEEFVKFVMLFSIPLWILVGSLAALFGVFWWRFVVPKHPIYAFLGTFTATLGNPLKEPPNKKARLFILFYTCWIFFVQAAYHGLLTSVLTVPLFAPEIDTLQELEQSPITIYAATRFKDMFLQNIGGSLTNKLVNRIERVPDDPDIEILVKKRGRYAIVQKETFAMLSVLKRDNYKPDGSPIYRMVKEKPMPTQVCYALRYGSALIPKINKMLRRFQEIGLDKYWKRITIHRVKLDEKYGEIPAPVSLRVLTFANISIAFVALGFGFSLAFVILICEKCLYRCKNK